MLAAARMGTGEVGQGNYRHHLCRLLGLEDAHMPTGFDDLYYLWDALAWWLDERNGGDRGISTIVKDPGLREHWVPDLTNAVFAPPTPVN